MRAVESGMLDRFGTIDPTGGGESHRFSLSVDWRGAVGEGTLNALVYGVDYELDLISNFTYFYESQLAGEAAPVADIHFHPVEPRTIRMTVSASF